VKCARKCWIKKMEMEMEQGLVDVERLRGVERVRG
jgi:hypothetical protein